MANDQDHWKNTTNILLSVIGGLLVFFGSISVTILTKLVDKVDVIYTTQAIQGKEQENQKTDLSELKVRFELVQPKIEKLYANKEQEDQFKPRSK